MPNPKKSRRACKQCGTPVPDRHNIFCSQKCMGEFRTASIVQAWKSGEHKGQYLHGVVSSSIRKYLFQTRGEKCEQCGWNTINEFTNKVPLTIDHIDGDSSNSLEENLKILCPNCHSLTSTYGGANRGRGRKSRYKQV